METFSRDSSSFLFFLQGLAPVSCSDSTATLPCSTDPLLHTHNKPGTSLEIAPWASSVKRLRGLLFGKCVRPSLAVSTNIQLCWEQMLLLFGHSPPPAPQRSNNFSAFFFSVCVLTDHAPGEQALHAQSKLSQLLIMACTRNCWRKTTSTLFSQQMQHPAGQTSGQGEKQRLRNKKPNLKNKQKEIKWT